MFEVGTRVMYSTFYSKQSFGTGIPLYIYIYIYTHIYKNYKSKYKMVGVLPIRIV